MAPGTALICLVLLLAALPSEARRLAQAPATETGCRVGIYGTEAPPLIYSSNPNAPNARRYDQGERGNPKLLDLSSRLGDIRWAAVRSGCAHCLSRQYSALLKLPAGWQGFPWTSLSRSVSCCRLQVLTSA